jgi:hypothetical protein
MTASQQGYKPLSGWQYERCPLFARHVYQVFVRSTDVNLTMRIGTGTTTILERSPIQGGGTAGTTPNEFTTSPITFVADPGDLVDIDINETAGGTPTVDLLVKAEPYV